MPLRSVFSRRSSEIRHYWKLIYLLIEYPGKSTWSYGVPRLLPTTLTKSSHLPRKCSMRARSSYLRGLPWCNLLSATNASLVCMSRAPPCSHLRTSEPSNCLSRLSRTYKSHPHSPAVSLLEAPRRMLHVLSPEPVHDCNSPLLPLLQLHLDFESTTYYMHSNSRTSETVRSGAGSNVSAAKASSIAG